MKTIICLLYLVFILHNAYAPPVTQEKKEQDSEILEDLSQFAEYHRYLKEVVQALESDPEFRDRLEKADEDDVRSGKIADQLDFVNHNVRTKLDEIKRRELDRLRHLAGKQMELMNTVDAMANPPSAAHLDHGNPHTFEIEDLKKLIKQTTADLEAADKQRQEQFKEYEMQKEYEKHQKIESMDEAQKKEFMDQNKIEEEAMKHHQPLHHPGSKQQLEEVWEKQDHMDQQFDPKAFFMMHDVDGNGVWDADEVKALFIKELDKMYAPNGPNKDLHERAEEMERMREHVFKENDHNRDGLIDFKEFIMETQKADFNQDEGWKSIDENQIYTQAEYEQYERRRLDEMRYLQQRGLVDAHGRPLPGSEHQIHKALQQKYAYDQAYQQYPQHGQDPSMNPPGHPQAPAQQHGYQQHPGQAPQFQGQQQHPGQAPQFQGQQQYQGQLPPHAVPQSQGGYQSQGIPHSQGAQFAQGPPPNVNQVQPPVIQAQPVQPGQYQGQQGQVQGQPGQVQGKSGPVQGQPGQVQAPPGQVQQPNQILGGQHDQYQGQPGQVQSQIGQGQSQLPPVPGQNQPAQGQAGQLNPPNQVPNVVGH